MFPILADVVDGIEVHSVGSGSIVVIEPSSILTFVNARSTEVGDADTVLIDIFAVEVGKLATSANANVAALAVSAKTGSPALSTLALLPGQAYGFGGSPLLIELGLKSCFDLDDLFGTTQSFFRPGNKLLLGEIGERDQVFRPFEADTAVGTGRIDLVRAFSVHRVAGGVNKAVLCFTLELCNLPDKDSGRRFASHGFINSDDNVMIPSF
jgi:hypothetical protein